MDAQVGGSQREVVLCSDCQHRVNDAAGSSGPAQLMHGCLGGWLASKTQSPMLWRAEEGERESGGDCGWLPKEREIERSRESGRTRNQPSLSVSSGSLSTNPSFMESSAPLRLFCSSFFATLFRPGIGSFENIFMVAACYPRRDCRKIIG